MLGSVVRGIIWIKKTLKKLFEPFNRLKKAGNIFSYFPNETRDILDRISHLKIYKKLLELKLKIERKIKIFLQLVPFLKTMSSSL